jgi:hypothetical protein
MDMLCTQRHGFWIYSDRTFQIPQLPSKTDLRNTAAHFQPFVNFSTALAKTIRKGLRVRSDRVLNRNIHVLSVRFHFWDHFCQDKTTAQQFDKNKALHSIVHLDSMPPHRHDSFSIDKSDKPDMRP